MVDFAPTYAAKVTGGAADDGNRMRLMLELNQVQEKIRAERAALRGVAAMQENLEQEIRDARLTLDSIHKQARAKTALLDCETKLDTSIALDEQITLAEALHRDMQSEIARLRRDLVDFRAKKRELFDTRNEVKMNERAVQELRLERELLKEEIVELKAEKLSLTNEVH